MTALLRWLRFFVECCKFHIPLRALTHHMRSDHRWQTWVSESDLGMYALEMPCASTLEMIAEWRAMMGDAEAWYRAHRAQIRLHPTTRLRVELLMGYTFGEVYQSWREG